MSRWRTRRAIVLAGVSAVASAGGGSAWAQEAVKSDANDARSTSQQVPVETIADLGLRGQATLVRNIIILERGSELWLPLTTTLTVLGFEIERTSEGFRGHFLSPDQSFYIDPIQRKAQIAGLDLVIGDEELLEINQEIYVSTNALNRWFRLEPNWDARMLRLDFDPPYVLPSEQAAYRARRGVLENRRSADRIDTTGFKRFVAPYRLVSWPTLTLNATAAYNRSGEDDLDGSLRLFAQGDMLAMAGRLAIATDFRGPTRARLTLGRASEAATLLGPLKATSFEFGDVVARLHALNSRSVAGVGFTMSNRERSYQQIDDGELIGDAPPGWQVELRRGGAVEAFTVADEKGRYRFNVPLAVGPNSFTIHLFGPDGQERVVERVVDNRPLAAPRGELRYAFSIVRRGSQFLDPIFGNASREEGPVPSTIRRNAETIATLELDFGIANQLSARSIAVAEMGNSASRFHVGGGLTTRIGSTDANGLIVIDNDGHFAGRLDLRGRLNAIGWRLSTEQYGNGFESGDNAFGGSLLQARRTASLDWRTGRWSFGMTGQAVQYRDSADGWSLTARAGGSFNGFTVTQIMGLNDFGGSARLYGSTIARSRLLGLQLRGSSSYELLDGKARFRDATVRISTRWKRLYMQGSAERDFLLDENRLSLRANRDFAGIRLGAVVEHSSRRGLYAGITLGFSLGRDAGSGNVLVGNSARMGFGAVRARFYHDLNADGRRDTSEPWVPNASLARARAGTAKVDDDGWVTLDRVQTRRPLPVVPNLSKVEDPFLEPVYPGYLLETRSGSVAQIEIPLQTTGQVIVRVEDRAGVPAANAPVVVQDCDGSSRDIQLTYEDGLAFFEGVSMGCQRINTVGADEIEIEVGSLEPAEVTLVRELPERSLSEQMDLIDN